VGGIGLAIEDELMELLCRINQESKHPVDEVILKQVLALVIKNPLDEDRADCQKQIEMLISQRIGGA